MPGEQLWHLRFLSEAVFQGGSLAHTDTAGHSASHATAKGTAAGVSHGKRLPLGQGCFMAARLHHSVNLLLLTCHYIISTSINQRVFRDEIWSAGSESFPSFMAS